MNVLVTGSNGFVGKNLVSELKNIRDKKNKKYDVKLNIFEYDLGINEDKLDYFCENADFVFHLAGVTRPKDESEFMKVNFGFTSKLLSTLKKYKNKAPVLITSSIQAALDNPYGKSKKAGEELVFKYGKDNNVNVYVFRLTNVFGKWSRPNFSSVVATFCYNISHNLPIKINNENTVLNLVYIDDVIKCFLEKLFSNENCSEILSIPKFYTVKLGYIAELIYKFKNADNFVPDISNEFEKNLYSTYLSFAPADKLNHVLQTTVDSNGYNSFTEMFKTPSFGQISVNISKPHIIKENHWHHTKVEKFVVVYGKGVIRFRNIFSDEVIEYFVSGDKIEVVDIPAGYTHNIENLGDTDMVTIMWCNEHFDPQNPDTYFEEV